jgi:septal ring factor EnvC (AmiA/AmiB activator)
MIMNKPRANVHFRLRQLVVFGLIACLAAAPLPAADDKAVKEKQLKTLLRKIDKMKQAIDVKEDSKSRYIKQLKTIEKSIGAVNLKIRKIGDQIDARKAELAALRATRLEHQRRLSRENEYLAQQVYSAFTLGRQEKVKLLFSQQKPQTLQRNLVYYQYFSNARVALINTVQTSIDKILETESLIQLAQDDLHKNQQVLAAQREKLKEDLGKRKTIIVSLDKQLKSQGGNLTRLEDEATQLQDLIESIQEIFDETPDVEVSREAFARLKGKLAWPVEGKVKRLFGHNKPLSNLRWQGVVIEAKSGSQVMAVSHGRVAFADWLRGLGNLIIIDHGNSYLSLYGHNESLFKGAGEWVEAGEVISSIGSSGGQKTPGLYFEIRKKGKPQNPTGWCKASNSFASG